MFKKIAAFCLATLLAAGPIITSTNSGATNYYGISASAASDYSYKDNYGVTYTFTVNDDQTATLTGFSNAKANLVLPSTVKANGVSYTVTELARYFGKKNKTVQTLTIPNTVTKMGASCFYDATNLKTINGGANVSEVGGLCFLSSAWDFDQEDKKGYSSIGKCIILYYSNVQTIDLSTNEFNNIKFIADHAFNGLSKLKYLTLPRNLETISIDAFGLHGDNVFNIHSNTETIKFFDSSQNKYVDLYDACMNDNRNSTQADFIARNYDAFVHTKAADRISEGVAKKIFQECDIAFVGAPGNTGYTALEEYQVVRKLYAYISQNYDRYTLGPDGSTNFKTEFFDHRGIVCFDYAQMLEYLCNKAGIECEYVSGEGHAWNVVKIGGHWFNIDCCATWTISRLTFLTPDRTVENELGNHHKSAEYQQYICDTQFGDINFDGMVDSTDASLILNAYTTMNKPNCQFSSLQLVLCDVNRDGKIDSFDACKVLAYYSYASTYKDENGNFSSDVPSIENYMFSVDGYTIMS